MIKNTKPTDVLSQQPVLKYTILIFNITFVNFLSRQFCFSEEVLCLINVLKSFSLLMLFVVSLWTLSPFSLVNSYALRNSVKNKAVLAPPPTYHIK